MNSKIIYNINCTERNDYQPFINFEHTAHQRDHDVGYARFSFFITELKINILCIILMGWRSLFYRQRNGLVTMSEKENERFADQYR